MVLQTPAAQVKGLRTYRKIQNDKCDGDSCDLKELTFDQKTFAESCDRYAGTVRCSEPRWFAVCLPSRVALVVLLCVLFWTALW
jgi:hypothetical protein